MQASLRNCGDLGLKPWMFAEPLVRRVVTLCCALPLLPDFGEEAMAPALYAIVRPFLAYYNETWITSQSRRPHLSVFGCIHRTNNVCEGHNRWLTHEVGTHQPNIFGFIGKYMWSRHHISLM